MGCSIEKCSERASHEAGQNISSLTQALAAQFGQAQARFPLAQQALYQRGSFDGFRNSCRSRSARVDFPAATPRSVSVPSPPSYWRLAYERDIREPGGSPHAEIYEHYPDYGDVDRLRRLWWDSDAGGINHDANRIDRDASGINDGGGIDQGR
jgi:hypothetical protein